MAQSSANSKLPLQSKKFLAFLLVVVGWKVLSFCVLIEFGSDLSHYGFMVLTTLIIVEGFFSVGYVLGQAALDKYTYLSETALKPAENSERIKLLEAELKRAQDYIKSQNRQ